uniref:ATP synthase F0 subunit 8 n=1 Tax=Osborniella crotophagae TaxID=1912107 RepID=A0A7T1HEZ2_9NEOP|nr:ATP synthase F0 subunit 8 [Osborniella crotophagae]
MWHIPQMFPSSYSVLYIFFITFFFTLFLSLYWYHLVVTLEEKKKAEKKIYETKKFLSW